MCVCVCVFLILLRVSCIFLELGDSGHIQKAVGGRDSQGHGEWGEEGSGMSPTF